MTGFEPGYSDVGSNGSVNCAKSTAAIRKLVPLNVHFLRKFELYCV